MRALLAIGVAFAAGCYGPTYEGVACGTGGSCPSGYRCATTGLCTAEGNGPGNPEADGGTPADGGLDMTADGGLDTTPPVTSIVRHPPEFDTETRPVFEFTCSEPPCTFECRVDDAAFAACVDSFLPDGLSEGDHSFEVVAKDAAGNLESPPSYVRWTLDLTPPSVTIATGPPAFSGTTVTFNFSADEPAQRFECSLDSVASGAFAACVPPVTYDGVSVGNRVFRTRAVDRAGQTGTATPDYAWTVDASVFSASIVGGPGATSGKNVTFSFGSTRPGSTFECSLDPPGAAAFVDCTNPTSFANLTGGAHTFYVRAENPMNTFSNPTSQIWTVDATGPMTTIGSAGVPAPGGWSTASALSFGLSCDEACTFECHLDSAAFAPLAGSTCTVNNLGDGTHTVYARATDAFGNLGGTVTRSWTTDRTVPTVTINDPFPANHCYSSSSVTIPFSAADANGIASRNCRVQKNGAVISDGACSTATGHAISGLQFSNLYEFTVTVTDPAGNPRSASVSWDQASVTVCNGA